MSWTTAELKVLKLRANEGLSASQIAAYLPGKSRNAVIGMLRRGKGRYGDLKGQPKNHAIGRATPTATPAPVVLKPKPERDFTGHRAAQKNSVAKASEDNGRTSARGAPMAGEASRLDAGRTASATSEIKDATAGETAPVSNLPAALPITFLDAVVRHRCLYFAGDWYGADGPDMPVCGAERSAEPLETRYCRRHQVKSIGVAA